MCGVRVGGGGGLCGVWCGVWGQQLGLGGWGSGGAAAGGRWRRQRRARGLNLTSMPPPPPPPPRPLACSPSRLPRLAPHVPPQPLPRDGVWRRRRAAQQARGHPGAGADGAQPEQDAQGAAGRSATANCLGRHVETRPAGVCGLEEWQPGREWADSGVVDRLLPACRSPPPCTTSAPPPPPGGSSGAGEFAGVSSPAVRRGAWCLHELP